MNLLAKHKILITNSTWMTVGLGIRSVFQAAYFILVARAIGPSQYGVFAATMALVGVLAPYSSWGSGNILIKHTSRNRDLFGMYWGAAIATTLTTSLLLTLIVLAVAKLVLPAAFDFWLVLTVALSELLIARLLYVSGFAFQAVERLDVTSKIFMMFSGLRLICAILFVSLPLPHDARTWSFFYLASTVLSAIPAVFWVYRSLGWGPISLKPILSELKEGFYFSLSVSSQGVYNDIDKTLLARISGAESAGFYAAAYRLIDVTFVPVTALLNSTYARFFKHGEGGLQNSKSFALRLLPWTISYTLLAALIVFLARPLITLFLGNTYAETAVVLLWLLPLLPLKATHYLAADSLTGAGFQGVRSAAQVAVSIFNLCINLVVIPLWGWRAAAASSWASDGLLVILLWWIVMSKAPHVSGQSVPA